MVGAVVAVLHLQGARAAGQAEQLMPQADAEHRQPGLHDFADRGDRVIAGLRVPGAVGQEDTVGLHRQHLGGGRLRRHHRELAMTIRQHAQNIALAAVIVGHHVVAGVTLFTVSFDPVPGALFPLVRRFHADFLGQVHAFEAGEVAGGGQRAGFVHIVAGQNAAVLGALVAQNARQPARVDVGDGDDAPGLEVLRQGLLGAPVAHGEREIAYHQASGPDAIGFIVFRVHPGIADVWIGQGHDLLGIRRIGENFLIAGHGGVEHHFTHGFTRGANGDTPKEASIFQS